MSLSYSKYHATRQIIDQVRKNITYLYFHYNKAGYGSVIDFSRTLTNYGAKKTIARNVLEKVIYAKIWDIDSRGQQWDIILWCAAADYANVELKELMFDDIEELDNIRGIIR